MIVVNLFAGPGAGKSTMAAAVFAGLKSNGVCAEMALEFAKDLTWERRYGALSCQPYVFGEQLWRLQRLQEGGVDVAVTDSPLLLSTVYGRDKTPPSFRRAVQDFVLEFDMLNFWVNRVKPYEPRGRRGSEESARGVDTAVATALVEANVRPIQVNGDAEGAATVVETALAAFRQRQKVAA